MRILLTSDVQLEWYNTHTIHTSWWDPWRTPETCRIFDKETYSLKCTLTVFLIAQFHTSNTFSYAQKLWFLNHYFHINTNDSQPFRYFTHLVDLKWPPVATAQRNPLRTAKLCVYEHGKLLYELCYLCKVKVILVTSGSVNYVLTRKIWILTNCSSSSWSPTPCSVRGKSSLFRYSTHSQQWHSVQVASLTLEPYPQLCNYTRFLLLQYSTVL